MSQDPARLLAEHVAGTGWNDLPPATVAATNRDIVDTWGCMLGGSGAPGIDTLLKLARHRGGREEASVLVHGLRLPAPEAALINGAMGHALDYDDTLDHGGSIHPGVAVLAAALAAAELRAASGRELLLAVALGLDVSCRIALAATLDRGWHRTAAIGVFGAATAAGKLLGLDAGRMEHALGIALSFASGSRQCILDGALTKRLQAGQAARDGVLSALLAAEDFTGTGGTLAGRFGFFALYQPNGYDLARLTDGLGRAFRGDEVSFKPYPCGRPLHALLDAAIAGRAELGITGGKDIAAMAVTLDQETFRDQFEGGPHRTRPTQIVQAQFALPFLVAVALLRGRVGIEDLERTGDPAVIALAGRIEGRVADGEQARDWARIGIRHVDGRVVDRETGVPSGSPQRPLTSDQAETKFRECAAHAATPLGGASLERVLQALHKLDDLEDVAALQIVR